jgi:DNA-binding MarR family transcriptional regulator
VATCIDYLKSCIEKSVRRQCLEFADECGMYGFWSNPFSGFEYPISSNFDLLFINRTKEIEEMSKKLVNSLLGRGEDVAVVGAEGMGTRSLINLFKQYIYALESEEKNHINTKIKGRLYQIFELRAGSANEDVLAQLKAGIEVATVQKKMILILSSFDEKGKLIGKESAFRNQFRKLLEFDRMSYDRTAFFSPWNVTAFDFMLNEEFSAVDIYEKVLFLEPFSKSDTEMLIKSRLAVFKHESPAKVNLFSEEGIKEIAEFSGGIPKFALKFSSLALEEAIKSKRESPLTAKYVDSLLKQLGYVRYDEMKKKLKELIPKHWWETKHGRTRTEMKILKNAILMGAPSTSTEIAKLIGKSRVAVLENLKKLEKAGIIKYIEHVKDSRTRPFVLNDFAKSIFEHEFIIPEIKEKLKSETL